MTKLLISVQNAQEATLAMAQGVDLLDLKDPAVGALGALNLEATGEIITLVDGRVTTSATVGEQHANLDSLLQAIEQRAEIGVDIVKLSVREWLADEEFATRIRSLAQHVKLVAVFFGDEPFELAYLSRLADWGFYGAMLDTRNKSRSLVAWQSAGNLNEFVHTCEFLNLVSGLAGSIGLSQLETIVACKPDFVGMRGGVCMGNNRVDVLNAEAIKQTKSMLLLSNIHYGSRENSRFRRCVLELRRV